MFGRKKKAKDPIDGVGDYVEWAGQRIPRVSEDEKGILTEEPKTQPFCRIQTSKHDGYRIDYCDGTRYSSDGTPRFDYITWEPTLKKARAAARKTIEDKARNLTPYCEYVVE